VHSHLIRWENTFSGVLDDGRPEAQRETGAFDPQLKAAETMTLTARPASGQLTYEPPYGSTYRSPGSGKNAERCPRRQRARR